MGLRNIFDHLRVSKYEDIFLLLESQEKCMVCDGKGFKFSENEFVLLDNSHKCSRCNGNGYYSASDI